MARPQTISRMPTVRRYHFEGIFTPKRAVSGNTLAYLTYSVRCKREERKLNMTSLRHRDIINLAQKHYPKEFAPPSGRQCSPFIFKWKQAFLLSHLLVDLSVFVGIVGPKCLW